MFQRNTQIDREDAGVEQMMHILCTHQRFRSKTRSCREILEGNGEKYYKEMQGEISLEDAEKCYAVSCEAKSLFGNFDLKESREENIENANSRLGHLQKY